ncbi:MAG: flagellar motor protein MotB [Desulfovibrionaceae bacterium]
MKTPQTDFDPLAPDFRDILLAPADEPVGGADWAVPWSDLMMVMFVLFVVLFIYARTHQDVRFVFRGGEPGAVTRPVDSVSGLIGHIAGRSGPRSATGFTVEGGPQVVYRSESQGVTVLREGGERLRIILRGDVFFPKGGAELAAGAEPWLMEAAELLRLARGGIHVLGYADQGEVKDGAGFSLSAERAADVARFYIDHVGIDPNRFAVSGLGAFEPSVPDTDPAHDQKNRRVEIVLIAPEAS